MTEQADFFGDTLADARRILQENLDDGMTCPCCNQFARRYRRKIYGSQARQLISLYFLGKKQGWLGFFHRTVVTRVANNNDLGFLRHWGLLELKPNDDSKKKDSGFYRITELGRKFVECEATVAKYCIQYNDGIEGFCGEQISIIDALGKNFSYQELMNQ